MAYKYPEFPLQHKLQLEFEEENNSETILIFTDMEWIFNEDMECADILCFKKCLRNFKGVCLAVSENPFLINQKILSAFNFKIGPDCNIKVRDISEGNGTSELHFINTFFEKGNDCIRSTFMQRTGGDFFKRKLVGYQKIEMNCLDLFKSEIGESEKLVKLYFNQALFCRPSVLVIDRLDFLLSTNADHNVKTIKCQILSEIDNLYKNRSQVFLIFAADSMIVDPNILERIDLIQGDENSLKNDNIFTKYKNLEKIDLLKWSAVLANFKTKEIDEFLRNANLKAIDRSILTKTHCEIDESDFENALETNLNRFTFLKL